MTKLRPYIVLVTGARTYPLIVNVYRKLYDVREKLPSRPLEVWQGECPNGPDSMAKRWVRQLKDPSVTERGWRAHWEIYGNRAGPERNTAMVNGRPNVCLAFFAPCVAPRCIGRDPHWSHGTSDCAKKAVDAKIPVVPSFWTPIELESMIPPPSWLP